MILLQPSILSEGEEHSEKQKHSVFALLGSGSDREIQLDRWRPLKLNWDLDNSMKIPNVKWEEDLISTMDNGTNRVLNASSLMLMSRYVSRSNINILSR